MEVVGVVGDMKQSFVTGSKPEMFVPYPHSRIRCSASFT